LAFLEDLYNEQLAQFAVTWDWDHLPFEEIDGVVSSLSRERPSDV
jgi:hypothetical protein